ncbi:narbonolide/10-deoxymethynolide synthase PikA2, modules 3 and 4-like [Mercenaria mercenaria]|uniref:narbonolide/10-deoxymethynolide synthase PikA2, modules 3 and 4-like n=1 Tax=Mercenaria mercenaria TaxID=6596 RepID=UPI00234F0239|nr:narbonolide/10-deoxymethynolide synthase PikA2, modules 3 and 4-like [Mercenaria mercenaria]XP_053403991.1 narbonolide/10-deoxymethynolide synthase PikA2, modules 3 and 4-like [Mercenaria mercenaria]
MDDDIAVIGIGCRFPGADNIDEFWRVLVNGENHVVDIPSERWNNDAFYSENRDEPGKLYVKKAAFINRHDEWDNRLFGISDNEAAQVDPQQRYVLECVHMAMEDSGITRKQLQGSETGVFIGAMNGDYVRLFEFDHDGFTNYSATGSSNTIISARVSYVYNLQGPSMVIDTACSSSMTSIHLGCQAIRTGDCGMAICGGVASLLSPSLFISLCKAKMLSPNCQCQAFCDTADGYVRGEGCGIVFLKPYKKAVEDKNKIWGILKTGVNQDGRMAQPLTAPAGTQQEKMLKKLYTRFNINPLDLQYIECHGTGTPVGDPTEVNALGNFIQTYKDAEKQRLIEKGNDTLNQKEILIGSVKTNIGHLESAAGIAALIKVLLMMQKGKFVPSLHVKKDKSNLNKKIKFEDYGLGVSVDVSDWPPNADGQRVCCVNSFGFGGSNSHAVIIQKVSDQGVTPEDPSKEMKVINISALDKTALKLSLPKLKEDISSGLYNLQDVSFTSFFHREQFATKTLIYGRNIDEVRRTISQKLHDIDELETPKKVQYIFVFCGVGTAWKGMCQEMMETQPAFRSTVAAIDNILEPLAGWRMADKFSQHTDYSDPFLNHVAIFCTQVALFKLWQSWGISPKVIIGQSVGEVAAAYASGALTLNDAVQVIFNRSKSLARQTGGCMMVVGNYALDKLEKLCTKYDKRVVIAVFNSPLSCTLSGDTDVMENIKSELEALNERENAGILIKVISVQCAYHSQHVDPCLDEIRRNLADIKSSTGEIPQISTVTGELAGKSDFHTGKYWADNIRKPVRFMQAVQRALKTDVTNVFVEIGPRQVLRVHLKNIVDNVYKGICLPSMNDKKENDCIYASLSTLHEFGAEINWQNIIQSSGHVVAIPRYVGKTTNSLYIPQKHQTLLKGINSDSEAHMYVRGESDKLFLQIDKESTPFVYDHYFYNVVLVPGATYIEAAFAIGQRITEINAFEIAVSAEFENTLMPQGNNQYLIDIQIEDDVGSKRKLFVARSEGKTLCSGTISQRQTPQRSWLDVYPIKERCAKHKTQEECYAFLEQGNFKYGDSLRIMRQAWATNTECLVEFDVEDSVKSQCKSTHFHPCIIDGLFQSVAILSKPDRSNSSPTLPKGVNSVVINRPLPSKMFAYTQLLKRTDIGSHYNFLLITPDGHVIAELEDFYVQTMSVPSTLDKISFNISWRQVTTFDFNKDEDEGHVVVFGTKRFIECYKAAGVKDCTFIPISVCDDKISNEDSFRNAMSKYSSFLRAIVFAPCYNIQHILPSEIGVYQTAKETFLTLRQLLTVVQENTSSLNVPLYVVTENTIASDRHNISASNICGSELWGMARSSVLETAFDNLVLIDMELTKENMANLQKITRSMVKDVKEYLLNCGQVFCSEILEYNESKPMTAVNTEITLDTCDYAALKTSNPAIAKNLYFELCQNSEGEDKRSTQECMIRLHSFCLHDPSLFPISPVLLDTEEIIWPEDDSKGFQMMCLEGIGWEDEKFLSLPRTNPTVGFCFPTDVKTVIRIPSEYTFDPECFSKYIPGMMSVAVIILKIVESCERASNVCVVVDNDSNPWLQLTRALFSSLSSSTVHVEQKDLVSDARGKNDAQMVVILSKVTHKHIEKLHFRFPGLRKVISLEQYLPMYMKIWIEHEISGVETDVIRTEDIFTSSKLPERVKTVTEILRSSTKFENITETKDSERTEVQKEKHRPDILQLPFPSRKRPRREESDK